MNFLKRLIICALILAMAVFIGMETKYYVRYHGNAELLFNGPAPERVCVLEIYGICVAREDLGSIGSFVKVGKYKWYLVIVTILIAYILSKATDTSIATKPEQKSRQ